MWQECKGTILRRSTGQRVAVATYKSSCGGLGAALAAFAFAFAPPLPFFLLFPPSSLSGGVARCRSSVGGLGSLKPWVCWRKKSSEATGGIQIKGCLRERQVGFSRRRPLSRPLTRSENGSSSREHVYPRATDSRGIALSAVQSRHCQGVNKQALINDSLPGWRTGLGRVPSAGLSDIAAVPRKGRRVQRPRWTGKRGEEWRVGSRGLYDTLGSSIRTTRKHSLDRLSGSDQRKMQFRAEWQEEIDQSGVGNRSQDDCRSWESRHGGEKKDESREREGEGKRIRSGAWMTSPWVKPGG